MNGSIGIERLEAAWAALDARSARIEAQLLQQAQRGGIDALRRRLRPLRWGQLGHMALGLALLLLAIPVWSSNRDVPHVLAAGLLLHAYGVAQVTWSGVTLGLLSALDYGAPVLTLQARLLRLQQVYVRGSTALGLAWWLMWIPFAMVAFAALGVDFYLRTAVAMPWMLASGVVGLLATWAFDRWARGRPALYASIRRGMAGRSLRAAQAELEALLRLERD